MLEEPFLRDCVPCGAVHGAAVEAQAERLAAHRGLALRSVAVGS